MCGVRIAAPMLAVWLAGCAGYSPTVGTADKPGANDAYLYGRFQVETREMKFTISGHQTMGFVLKCTDGNSYTIRFERGDAVQVVKIAPSTCSTAEFVYTDADGFVRGRKPAPDALKKEMTFAAGKAYYLGDFQGESTYTGGVQRWRVQSGRNNYAATTEKLKSAYPNLSALPTENRMLGR